MRDSFLSELVLRMKHVYSHEKFGIVYVQFYLKDGKVSILKTNGESLTAMKEDLQEAPVKVKLVRYINRKLGIIDADNLSTMSLKKLAIDFLNEENDVESALAFAELCKLDLVKKVA